MNQDKFFIQIQRDAERELAALAKETRLTLLDAIQKYLSSSPYQPIKTRIKRMSGFNPTLYRLRVGDYRAYYRIDQQRVVILAVLHKKDAAKRLRTHP